MYSHTILVPQTLTFKPEYYKCSCCGEQIQKHIICEGARWHVHSYFGTWDGEVGRVCSEKNCEDNHGKGKCGRQNE